MIYGFARQSGGYAKIESGPGHGTTVRLHLPRYLGELQDEIGSTAGIGEHASERGEVVLVVEDEATVRGLILDVLDELGYRVLEAKDGPDALEVLENAPRIDLLVTDIGLPEVNGRQVADIARRGRPGLKVLFITGYAGNAALPSGSLEPGMELLSKPFSMEALAARIKAMIEG